MRSSLAIFATIVPRPEYFDSARRAIEAILERTRAEPGCAHFSLYVREDGRALHLFEGWADRAALDAHYAQPYTRDVMSRYDDWLAKPLDITFMQPAE